MTKGVYFLLGSRRCPITAVAPEPQWHHARTHSGRGGPVVPGRHSLAPREPLSRSATVPGRENRTTPTVLWLSPDTATSGLVTNLEITRPILLEITAFGPLGGLLVQVMEPATHLAILSTDLPYTLPFQVNVMMMCGSQVAEGQPWIPSDFVVTAAIGLVGQASVGDGGPDFPRHRS